MKGNLNTKSAMRALAWLGFLMAAITSFAFGPVEAGVYFIKLGGKGNATLVKSVSGSTASYGLVDTGSSADYTNYVAPYLTSVLGSTKLSFIALSHMHSDHMGGAVTAINSSFVNSSTTLYLKDVADPESSDAAEADAGQKADAIIAAAKAKSMPIGKVKPYETLASNSVHDNDDIQAQSDAKFKAKIEKFTKNAQGSYVSTGVFDTITFGRFTLTWFNGNNWCAQPVSPSWDENVNSATLLLKCTTSAGKIFRTYLGADVGENSANQYSAEIGAKIQAAIGTAVSVYQVAHHGFYYSLKDDTIADTLNPKYAIVTESYNELVYRYCVNHSSLVPDPNNPSSAQLSLATSTLKETLNSTALVKMYFLNGKQSTTGPVYADYRIIDALKDNSYALLKWTGTTIKAGNVNAEFDANDLAIDQP